MRGRVILGLCIVIFGTGAALTHGQCTVGQNMPPSFVSSGYPVAWLKNRGVACLLYEGYLCDASGCEMSTWTSSLAAAADTAMANWANARATNNSGVFFYKVSAAPDNSSSGDPSYPWRPWVAINRLSVARLGAGLDGITYSGWHVYHDNYAPAPWQTRIGSASIYVRNTITDATYMTHTVVHEIGHTMALQDCYNCQLNTTVMDDDVGILSPSSCDNQQSRNTAFP